MFNVALIGAGNIGLSYDYGKSNKSALSHIKGIYLHKAFNLKYAVDKNKSVFTKIKSLFPKAICLGNWNSIRNNNDIDVLVIALPTGLHHKCLKDFEKNKNIKIFFIEKPMFTKPEEFKNIDKDTKDKIVVNYIRRFEPQIISLKKDIFKGVYKKPQRVICKYTKGFKNNASHAIDLLNYFLGGLTFTSVKILSKKVNFYGNDVTADFVIEAKYKDSAFLIYFLGLDDKKYSIFEIDLLFENKRVEITDFARIIKIHNVVCDPEYKGYKALQVKGKTIKTSLDFVMLNAYKHIEKVIKDKKENNSSFYNELNNFKITQLIERELRYA